MAGRLLDWLGAGLAASRPSAATMATLVPSGSLAFYWATDTQALSFFDQSGPSWKAAAFSTAAIQTIIAASNIGDLADVSSATPANNDVLTFDTASGLWKPAAGGGGGGGGVGGIGLPEGLLAGTAAGTTGFYLARRVFCGANITINHVAFMTTSASATAKYQPFVYACTPPNTGGALLGSGAQVTGVTTGYNEASLTSGVALVEGNFYIVGCSVITHDIDNMFVFSTGFSGIFASNGGASTVPSNPAPAFSTGGTLYGFWGTI